MLSQGPWESSLWPQLIITGSVKAQCLCSSEQNALSRLGHTVQSQCQDNPQHKTTASRSAFAPPRQNIPTCLKTSGSVGAVNSYISQSHVTFLQLMRQFVASVGNAPAGQCSDSKSPLGWWVGSHYLPYFHFSRCCSAADSWTPMWLPFSLSQQRVLLSGPCFLAAPQGLITPSWRHLVITCPLVTVFSFVVTAPSSVSSTT